MNPYPEGTTEASLHGGPECGPQGQGQYTQNKGKGKAAWQYIHYNLLNVGWHAECKATTPEPAAGPR